VICPLFLRFATDFTKTFVVLTAVYGLWMVSYALFSRGSYSLQEASTLVTAVVYVVFGFCSAVLVRDSQFGFLSIWLIYIASWIPDTGAYFIGVRFGRHKLIPEISPHKTVEGFVGGLLCGMLIFLIYGDIVTLASSALNAHIIRLLLAGAVLSLLSVVGDLIASFIKRSFKIKDFGNLLPGHGGILDRFDSVLAVSIAMYAFSTFFPLFESV
jgi:phosphatidate cytidylyltransferase